jgi:protein TonB
MTFDRLDMTGLATRRLLKALVASLLFHLFLFWPDGSRLLSKDTPSVLQATLHTLPRPAEPAPPFAPAQRAMPKVSAPVAPAPMPDVPLLESSKSVPVPQTPAATAESTVKPSLANVPAPVSAGPTAGQLLIEASASGDAVDGLRGYRLAIASQARRFKRYPAQAMAAGWAGTADIRVEVGSDGRRSARKLAREPARQELRRSPAGGFQPSG